MACGNIEKVERLYNNYSKLLYKVALGATNDKHLAEDAVQQTFEKVIRIADKINEENVRATGGLLILMCKQAVSEQHRAKVKSIGEQIVDEDGFEAVSHEELWEVLVRKGSEEHMKACLKWLKPKYREPIIYRYVYELEVEAIAELLGLNVHTVYTRLNRGRELIKRRVIGNGGELG